MIKVRFNSSSPTSLIFCVEINTSICALPSSSRGNAYITAKTSHFFRPFHNGDFVSTFPGERALRSRGSRLWIQVQTSIYPANPLTIVWQELHVWLVLHRCDLSNAGLVRDHDLPVSASYLGLGLRTRKICIDWVCVCLILSKIHPLLCVYANCTLNDLVIRLYGNMMRTS